MVLNCVFEVTNEKDLNKVKDFVKKQFSNVMYVEENMNSSCYDNCVCLDSAGIDDIYPEMCEYILNGEFAKALIDLNVSLDRFWIAAEEGPMGAGSYINNEICFDAYDPDEMTSISFNGSSVEEGFADDELIEKIDELMY